LGVKAYIHVKAGLSLLLHYGAKRKSYYVMFSVVSCLNDLLLSRNVSKVLFWLRMKILDYSDNNYPILSLETDNTLATLN